MRFYRKYEDNCVKVTYSFLKEFGINTSFSKIKSYLNAHFHKETLLSVSDLLSEFDLVNKAIKVSENNLEALPVPFITGMSAGDGERDEFTIVKKVSATGICILDNKSYSWKELSKDEFIQKWTGVVLVVVSNGRGGDSCIFPDLTASDQGVFKYFGVLALMLAVYLIFSFRDIKLVDGYLLALYFLNLLGIFISFHLVKLDLGYNDRVTKSLCNLNEKLDCNTILNSKGASIWGVKWAVIGLSYFLANIVFLALDTENDLVFLASISFFSIFYVAYAILYQGLVVKRWCLLCLLTQGVLLLQFGMFALTLNFNEAMEINISSVLYSFLKWAIIFLVIFLMLKFWVLPIYGTLKSMLVKIQSFKNELFTRKMFDFSLANQKEVSNIPAIGMFQGNASSSIVILNICNPYCQHCASSQLELMRLLSCRPHIRVQTIFLIFSENWNIHIKVVNHFLNLNLLKDDSVLISALNYWYSTNELDYEKLIALFPIKGQFVDFELEIIEMLEWCKKNEIKGTPSFFVNGRALPGSYDVIDLKYIF